MIDQPQTEKQSKPGKPRYKSKTYQFGAALVTFGIALLTLPEFAGLVNGLIPAQYVGFVPVIIGAIVGILREVTTEPIAGREPPKVEQAK